MGEEGNFQVYKSSAGSGKTFTLARVFLSLILEQNDPLYFRRILAITFTVKAASEMKDRIIAYLSGFAGRPTERKDIQAMMDLILKDTKLDENEVKSRSERVLLGLIHNYGDLSILTIDKFIHRLVRSFASDLNLTSDFEIEIEHHKLVESVLESLLDKVGQDMDITKVIMEFVDHQVSDDKSWDVSAPLSALVNELNGEEFFLKSKSFEALTPQNVFEIQKWLEQQINKIESRFKACGQKAINIIENAGLEAGDFYYADRGIFGYFRKASVLNFGTSGLLPNSYAEKTIEDDKWMSATKHSGVSEVSDQLRVLYHELVGLIPELEKSIFYRQLKSALYTMALIGELRHLLRNIKEDENLQTLSDFYRVLSDRFSGEHAPFIYERLGQRYNHVLIDEFQDTSTLQWQNLLPLVENSLSEGKKSLIVGDAKQSIYRFRGSEPEQFVGLPATGTGAAPLLSASYSEFVLNANYRSTRTVVEFNNRFFDQLKNELLSESLSKVYHDLKQEPAKSSKGAVHIHCVETDEERITEYVHQMESRVSKLTTNEGFQPGDICILFQRNADAAFVAGSLLELGYKVTSDESLLLANNHSVQLIIATLRAHANSNDPFAQQQWLARLYQNDLLKSSYHNLAMRVKEAKMNFAQIAKELKFSFNFDVLNSGLSFSIIHYLSEHYEFKTSDAFTRRLLDYALEFDQQAMYLKKSFLAKWDEDSDSLSIDAVADSDAIRIMTIHKSKGLEFPVVLLYLPNLKTNKVTKNYSWITNIEGIPNLSAAMMETSNLKNTPYSELYMLEKERTNMDLLNALYVAFTRAEKQLEVFTNGKNGEPQSKQLQFITKWPDWDADSASLNMAN